jgi:hypothetical protein
MAGCAAAGEIADACCQQNSCPREPQHSDDCPYKIRDTRQADAKFNLTLEASLRCQLEASPKVFEDSRHAALVESATPFAESGRFLTLRGLRI